MVGVRRTETASALSRTFPSGENAGDPKSSRAHLGDRVGFKPTQSSKLDTSKDVAMSLTRGYFSPYSPRDMAHLLVWFELTDQAESWARALHG